MCPEAGYDEEKDAVQMVQTKITGYNIDLNNVPGKIRMLLVRRGEIDNPFPLPANMPGKKLAELRKVHANKLKTELENSKLEAKPGNYVEVGKNNNAYLITEVDEEYVYFEKTLKNGSVKKLKVPLAKARIVAVGTSSDDDEVDENTE